MNKLIVNENVILGFKVPVTGVITILPVSIKGSFKLGGFNVYNSISFSISGATNGTIINGTGAGILNGNSTKLKSNNLPVVKEDSEIIVTITGVLSGSPATFPATVIILNAGQTKVKGI